MRNCRPSFPKYLATQCQAKNVRERNFYDYGNNMHIALSKAMTYPSSFLLRPHQCHKNSAITFANVSYCMDADGCNNSCKLFWQRHVDFAQKNKPYKKPYYIQKKKWIKKKIIHKNTRNRLHDTQNLQNIIKHYFILYLSSDITFFTCIFWKQKDRFCLPVLLIFHVILFQVQSSRWNKAILNRIKV